MSETHSKIKALLEALVAGLLFGIFAFACAFAILMVGKSEAQSKDWDVLPGCAGGAAFLTGIATWWLILARPQIHSLGRGLGAGALVGILSHPFAWYFFGLIAYFSGAEPGVDEIMDPLQLLLGAVVFSLGSWACVGWLTVPLGAMSGAAFAPMMKWLFGT